MINHLYMAWLALSGLCLMVSAIERPCTIHDGDKFYDLSPLKASKDYQFRTPAGLTFVLNICKPVAHETWHLPNPAEVAGFIRRDRGDFSIGMFNTTLGLQNDHPQLILSNGSSCAHAPEQHASTAIEFICDMSVFGAGKAELVAQLPPGDEDDACSFFFEWRTHYACEASEQAGRMGFFAVLAVLLLIFLMLYIVLGTLYNRFALNRRGAGQIPEFSVLFFYAVVQWVVYLVSGFFDRMLRRSSRTSVNPHSHHWSEDAGGVDSRRARQGARGAPSTIFDEEEGLMDPSQILDEGRDPEPQGNVQPTSRINVESEDSKVVTQEHEHAGDGHLATDAGGIIRL